MNKNNKYTVKTTVDKESYDMIQKDLDNIEYPLNMSCWLRYIINQYFSEKEGSTNE